MEQQLRPFSISQGKEATDWWAELTILKELKNKGMTSWDMDEHRKWEGMTHQSGSWVTCACGNMCEIIPRRMDDSPSDLILRNLGYEFHSDIKSINPDKAVKTLIKIEKRSNELIREINKSKSE